MTKLLPTGLSFYEGVRSLTPAVVQPQEKLALLGTNVNDMSLDV